MSVSTELITTTPPRYTMRKNWSREENAVLQAAVQQHLATHKFLDWDAIAAAIPGRTAHSAEIHYYVLLKRPAATAPDYSKPRAVAAPTVRRPCLRCRSLFDSVDRKRNWICESCKRSVGENPYAEARIERHTAAARDESLVVRAVARIYADRLRCNFVGLVRHGDEIQEDIGNR